MSTENLKVCIKKLFLLNLKGGARVAQWWEHQIQASTSYVGWVCVWFSPILLRKLFPPPTGTPVSSLLKQLTLPNSNSTWNARTRLNKFLRTLQFYNLPVTYIPWRIIVKCKVDGILSRVAKQQSSVWNSIHCDSWEDLLLHREKPSDLAVWASHFTSKDITLLT